MNTKRVNAAAGVIHGSQMKGKQTATGIAADLEAACLLQSPETAAEMRALRARVAELEAAQDRARAHSQHLAETLVARTEDLIAAEAKSATVEVYLSTPCDTCDHTLNWHRNDVGCTVGDCVCGRFVEPSEPQPDAS